MLRDAAVDLLMNRLGQRKNETLKDQIIGEMVFVQETLLEGNATLMWFLLTEDSDATTTVDDERISLPNSFLQEWEEGGLYVLDTSGAETELVRNDWDILQVEPELLGTGSPRFYDLAGEYILLRKIPDAVYTLKMRYYGRQTSLAGVYGDAANVENNWLKYASDWMIGEVGAIIAAQYLQSEKMAQRFQGQAQVALDRLIKKNTAFVESNKLRNMDA